MPVVLSDEEYEALKNPKAKRDETPGQRLERELNDLPDNDRSGFHEVIERYNKAVAVDEDSEDDEDSGPEYTEEEFYADIEAVPDGDRNAMREVLEKHGRLMKTEG